MPSSVTWEVLVVDNNSTDQTREVVCDFHRRQPERFRYLLEPKPGKSYALNAGIANAGGEVLAFLDDDVTVEPTWLHNLTAELHGGEWAGSGGRILPRAGFKPPAWLAPSQFGILYGHFDLGDQPSELTCAPFGSNMAFRKDMFEKYGGFRTDLGPGPKTDIPRPNEDTEFGRRLIKAGERLRYEPWAVIRHPILPDRLRKEYFCAWWFDLGRAMIRERGDQPDVFGIPRDYLALISRFVEISTQTLRGMFAPSPPERFDYKCQVWKNKGQMVELWRRFGREEKAAKHEGKVGTIARGEAEGPSSGL